MDPKLRRKLIVSGVGLTVFVGLFAALYILYLGPRLKVWREARQEVSKREKRLDELKKAFANVRDPQDELKVLEHEINNLAATIQKLEKIKTVGTETSSLPKELHDPDPAIRRELYKDYMKQVMDVAGNNIKEKLKSAQISPPDIKLYEDLKEADEVAYYMNRAGGLQGVVDALAQARTPDGTLVIDEVLMQDYKTGSAGREGAVNVLSYLLKMTLDTQTLISFLYHLQEQDEYYFIESMNIKPRGTPRDTKQQVSVEAKIGTTMVFQSQVQKQVQAVLAEAGKTTAKGGGSSWMLRMAQGMKKQQEKPQEQERKWYEFWKLFKK